ncbi:unnamed protein product [Linum trigynum]|uniref:Uncharacterized protein n=1 Tax=Linum trigynum TaxID=586398 RepID=A0AAV2FC04_9ROSI
MEPSLSITFSGSLFFEPALANCHRHRQFFERRPIAPSILSPFEEFHDLALDVNDFIQNLGWGFLLGQFSSMFCPILVRYFYSNLRSDGFRSRVFSTLFQGHLITIPVVDLGRLLDIPAAGETIAHESELWRVNFNVAEEFVHLSGVHPGPALSLPVNVLLPCLRAFHFVLTRVFLPRFQSFDRVTPLDLWVMSLAVAHVPLNDAHLVFGSMLSFGDVHFPGPLPFGPLITRLFSRLAIDLSSFRTISPTQYVSIDQMLDDLEIAIGGEVFPASTAIIEDDEAEVEPVDVEPEENVEPEEEDDSTSEDLFPADLVVLYETDEEDFGSDDEDRF